MGFWDAVAAGGPYAPHHSIFTGRMLFMPNSLSTEGSLFL